MFPQSVEANIVKGERKDKFENFVCHLPFPNRILYSRKQI